LNFGKLILMKTIENAAIRWHILKLKCTKFDFGWGFAPDPAGGAYRFFWPSSKGNGGGGKGRRYVRGKERRVGSLLLRDGYGKGG